MLPPWDQTFNESPEETSYDYGINVDVDLITAEGKAGTIYGADKYDGPVCWTSPENAAAYL